MSRTYRIMGARLNSARRGQGGTALPRPIGPDGWCRASVAYGAGRENEN
jgi:hypothetical protein